MDLPDFLPFTTLGTTLWTTLPAFIGYLLEGRYRVVADCLNPATNISGGLAVAAYRYRVATRRAAWSVASCMNHSIVGRSPSSPRV